MFFYLLTFLWSVHPPHTTLSIATRLARCRHTSTQQTSICRVVYSGLSCDIYRRVNWLAANHQLTSVVASLIYSVTPWFAHRAQWSISFTMYSRIDKTTLCRSQCIIVVIIVVYYCNDCTLAQFDVLCHCYKLWINCKLVIWIPHCTELCDFIIFTSYFIV